MLGWLPECRSSTIQQWVQGGSGELIPRRLFISLQRLADADPILAEFYVKCVCSFQFSPFAFNFLIDSTNKLAL